MQKFLQWLDDHGLLDPLEKAGACVFAVLYIFWCMALVMAAIEIGTKIVTASIWWLLAIIPWLLLVVITLTFYFYTRED